MTRTLKLLRSPPASSACVEPKLLSVRLPKELLSRVDAVVALAQSRGVGEITRSALIRDALTAYVEQIEDEFSDEL